MDFNSTFASADHSVLVKHPGGASFRLLPANHRDAWDRVMTKFPAKRLSKLVDVMQTSTDLENVSRHYETVEEFTKDAAALAAAHITGWYDLERDGPLEYSFEEAIKLVGEFPQFRAWIDAECSRIAAEQADVDENIEDAKKN